ncbi:MAG: UPF0182 family membrane protein [Mycobacteriales bacterium]
MPIPALSRRARIVLVAIVVVIVLLILVGSMSSLFVDWKWYDSIGRGDVFSTVLGTRVLLFFTFGVLMAVVLGANLVIAYRSRPTFHPMSQEQASLERYRTAIEPRRRLALVVACVVIGLLTAVAAQARWQTWLLFFNRTPFHVRDPQFHKDISFYAFTYPFERMILSYLFVAVFLSLLGAIALHYLFGGLRVQGPGEKVTRAARAHLSVLLGVFVLLKVIAYYLDRFGVLFSGRGGITGASYTDVNATLPAKAILFFVALICAIAFIANVVFRNFALPAIALVLLVLSSVLIGGAYPAIVQQFSVRPNANEKERPYIERNILATRGAFGIGNVKYQLYNATTSTASAEQHKISADAGTIPNARLLDPNVLAPTFDQLQRIRNYYSFSDKLDIDRYTVGGKTQDYVVGVRELDPSKLASNQTNWINKHLVYTHGNGFVAAPANTVNQGAPQFTTYDLPNRSTVSSMLPKQPRIYFGELFGDDYAIVGKNAAQGNVEVDYQANNGTDVKTAYTGTGGVKLGGLVNRLAFAIKYRERNILLSSRISSDSKILFVRDPRDRVRKAAPFLQVDGDPYPAVVNGRIVWIVDGYTTSDGYPYSERQTLGDLTKDSLTGRGTSRQPQQQFNYIRNSVKATVDAYDGTVTLYQFDKVDPVLQTWMKIFPKLIKPESAISPALRAHFRYPEDLFKVQRDLIASYHVSDPVQFFNSQNFWQVPTDPTAFGPTGQAQPQPPYFLLAQGVNQTQPTFQLTTALTALNRPNMAAYVSVSSDPGTYGKIQVLELPGDSSVSGPVQAQSQFTSNTDVASSIKLLQGGNSEVIFGNLLTLPVAGGLLYVEPLYVQGQGVAYPLLRKVLVLFGANVGYDNTLPLALTDMFASPGGQTNPPGGGTNPPPSSTPPSTGPPSSSAPPPGGGTPSVAAAVADIQAALAHLKLATQRGDFEGIGAAQKELAAAIAEFQAATGRSPTATPTG